MIIAIDGYSSCGKSTIAKALAQKLAYSYIDTGAMYRAVTLYALRQGIISDAIHEERLKEVLPEISIRFTIDTNTNSQITLLNGDNVEQEIRALHVAQWVSHVSSLTYVRQKMVEQQRCMARNGNVVMDGRDVGTVVLPDADIKFFITASVDVRAQRRYNELLSKGEQVSLQEIIDNITQRDHIDTTRADSPLRQAHDAILFDTSNVTKEEQLQWILNQIQEKLK